MFTRPFVINAMQYLHLDSTDPATNLALEEALLHVLHEGEPGYFLLWRNAPSIILGRNQNALEEINRNEVERRNLAVVRRSTGGGAVYHDLGNLNFSFLECKKEARSVDFARYLAPVQRALHRAGVEATLSGRNDLEVGGRKISGSAQRLAQDRVLHHGTLLVNADFEAMTRALQPDPDKFLSHGVASVRARVANVSEFWAEGMTLDRLCTLLCEEVGAEPGHIDASTLAQAQRIRRERYGSWEWNIGSSPRFTARMARRFPWGRVQICVQVRKGRIAECRIYGDFFAKDDVRRLEQLLVGAPLRREELGRRLCGVNFSSFFVGCTEEMDSEIRDFFLSL